jgi:RNA polymerase sigma-70 factor (ECF subfamily)
VTATPPCSSQVALVTALRRIPAEQRRAVVLHHLVGLSVEEIAAETGAPAGTVKVRLARGRAKLAPHVSEFADEPTAPDERVEAIRVTARGEDHHV